MSNLPPVCILTAGLGTRMGALSETINKALLPIDHKAAISHIVDQFPNGTNFIIALGYAGEQVKNYILMAHPNLLVKFIEVDRWRGNGSGPGYSLWSCKAELQCPFYFIACDSLFKMDSLNTPVGKNWIGVAEVNLDDTIDYCNVAIEDGYVTSIKDKIRCGPEDLSFTGVLYVKDYKEFWQGLNSETKVKNELQISNGLLKLIDGPGLVAIEVNWDDVGSEEKYNNIIASRTDYDFSKTNEFLYFVEKRVIKFFANPSIVSARTSKASIKPEVFPIILESRNQFYCYDLVVGETLYTRNNKKIFRQFLSWMDKNVWTPVEVNPRRMRELCHSFYYDKTLNRLSKFDEKYPDFDPPKYVNEEPIALLPDILARIDWESLYNGYPTFIHGDLQFDNILHDKTSNQFVLLDWRQDFSGELEFGDNYYDLAKLLGGIILNYDYIKSGLFSVEKNNDNLIFDFAVLKSSSAYKKILEDFILAKKLNLKKIHLLVGLIYLNMAPLHHPPFDQALYALGLLYLTRTLDKES
jgi:choline kinase/thiamine kinase-like enzyme